MNHSNKAHVRVCLQRTKRHLLPRLPRAPKQHRQQSLPQTVSGVDCHFIVPLSVGANETHAEMSYESADKE